MDKPNYNFNGKKILVVEDDIFSRKYAERTLEPTGADVITATNGAEAVKIFSERHIDLVIMDLLMPVLNGYDAAGQIRQSNKQIPIIALTAYDAIGNKARCEFIGFTDYLLKPVYPEQILSTIEKHLK
jgi:CheY-like chemotaxis protein